MMPSPELAEPATGFAGQFARTFLATREQFPRLDKVLLGTMGAGGLGMLVSLVGPYRFAIQWSVMVVSFSRNNFV